MRSRTIRGLGWGFLEKKEDEEQIKSNPVVLRLPNLKSLGGDPYNGGYCQGTV